MPLGSPLRPVESVKNLGVWFNRDFSWSKHIWNVYRSYFLQLFDYRRFRWFHTDDASTLVVSAFVSSLFDYCYSLFINLSKLNQRKLQCIQIIAARIA